MNNTTTAIDDDDSSRETISSSSTEDWTIPDVANDTLTDDEDDGGGGGSAKNLSDNFELGSETRTNTELKNDLDIEPFEQSPKITTKTAVTTTTAAITTTTPFYEEIRLTESSLSDKNVTSEGQSFLPTKSVKDLGSSLLNETSLLKHSLNVEGVTETTTKIYEEIRLTDSRVAAASEATPVDQDLHFNVILTNKNDVTKSQINSIESKIDVLKSMKGFALSPNDVLMSQNDVILSPNDEITSQADVTSPNGIITSQNNVIKNVSFDVLGSQNNDYSISEKDLLTSKDDLIRPQNAILSSEPNTMIAQNDVLMLQKEVSKLENDVQPTERYDTAAVSKNGRSMSTESIAALHQKLVKMLDKLATKYKRKDVSKN